MAGLHRVATAVAALRLLVAAGAQGADWELWADPSTEPPGDQVVWLPTLSDVVQAETDSSWVYVDVHQTRESQGQVYKALQRMRDVEIEATVKAGMYLGAAPGEATLPSVGVDCLGMMRALEVTVEVDGTVVPLEASTYVAPFSLDLGELGTASGYEWNVYPKFTTPGIHTYKVLVKQLADFFYTDNYAAFGLADPSPEFGGRRVYVGEQVGSPVDGYMVRSYTLNVVPPTAVESCSWARVKAAAQE